MNKFRKEWGKHQQQNETCLPVFGATMLTVFTALKPPRLKVSNT